MRLAEVKFSHSIRIPGTGSEFEHTLRAGRIEMSYDPEQRMVILGSPRLLETLMIPVDNVIYMVPDTGKKTEEAPATVKEVEASQPKKAFWKK